MLRQRQEFAMCLFVGGFNVRFLLGQLGLRRNITVSSSHVHILLDNIMFNFAGVVVCS